MAMGEGVVTFGGSYYVFTCGLILPNGNNFLTGCKP